MSALEAKLWHKEQKLVFDSMAPCVLYVMKTRVKPEHKEGNNLLELGEHMLFSLLFKLSGIYKFNYFQFFVEEEVVKKNPKNVCHAKG